MFSGIEYNLFGSATFPQRALWEIIRSAGQTVTFECTDKIVCSRWYLA